MSNSTLEVKQLSKMVEELAQASAALVYCKIKNKAKFANRFSSNKFLYFLLCGDAVKIGKSSDPCLRIKELQTGAPYECKLVATFKNMGHKENECHKKFKHLKLYGEWFRYTQEIKLFIESLKPCS